MPESPVTFDGPPDYTGNEVWVSVDAGPLSAVTDRSWMDPNGGGIPPRGGIIGNGNLNMPGDGNAVKLMSYEHPNSQLMYGYDVFEYRLPQFTPPANATKDWTWEPDGGTPCITMSAEIQCKATTEIQSAFLLAFGSGDALAAGTVGVFSDGLQHTHTLYVGANDEVIGTTYITVDTPLDTQDVYYPVWFLHLNDVRLLMAGDLRIRLCSGSSWIPQGGENVSGVYVESVKIKWWYVPAATPSEPGGAFWGIPL